jgi:glycosyltransferase involved in cell wall biosynthesis
MHLGLYHEPVHTDGRTFDTYGPYARYVLEFARHFDRVTIFAPTTDQPTYFSGVPLDAPNLTVAPLPFFLTHAQAYAHAIAIARVFRKHAKGLDAIVCRNTAPLGYILWLLARPGTPFIYTFTSDPFEVIARSPRYRGLFGRFARAAYGLEFAVQKFIMRRNYAFASGRALGERLRAVTPNVASVLTSALGPDDFRRRDDACTGRPVGLLYVGRLIEGKGLEELLEAVRRLVNEGRDVTLDLVGEGRERAALEARSGAMGLVERARFRGHAVMGPALNAFYNAADVFVLASVSEGSPKVVLEAMAHSVPVVATDVGNVGEMLDGGRRGVLLADNDPARLADGVRRLMDDADFRRQCIREGYAFTLKHSVSAYVARIAEKAREMAERSGREGHGP